LLQKTFGGRLSHPRWHGGLRYVVDYRTRRTVKSQLFTRILEEIDGSNDRIRLASATFELVSMPRLNVSFADGKGVVDPRYVP
jgi:hypothetical protein